MVATELALAYTPELVVVDLWFIEKQMGRNVRLSREGIGGYKDMFLDAKGNVIPGKAPNLLSQ
jgi:hypothetical protein